MTDNAILPGARAAFVNPDGTPSRAFYDYLRRQSIASSASGPSVAQLTADVVTLSQKLGADDGKPTSITTPIFNFVGYGGITATQDGHAVKLSLIDLADSGAGTLQAITRDAKGRITGTRDATITGTAGRVTVANGNAAAGVPTIDLATVADAGGGALLRFVRDAWGRITGTSAATTSDLTEGTNLYFTSTRVYTAAKAVLVAGSNVTIAADDTAKTLTIAATGGGGGGGGGGPGTDSLIDYVVALIPCSARNRSTGFVDLCGNVLVDMANVCGDSTVKQYGFNTMLNAGGGLTMFSAPGSGVVKTPALLIGTRDFCWEIDVAVTGTLAAFSSIVSNRPSNSAQTGTTCIGITSANQLYIYSEAAFVVNPTAATVVTSPGSFNKIAYDVVGGVGYLYLNGVLVGSGAQPALIYTSRVSIGANYDGTETIPANFANFRFTLGVNRYAGASSYTPLTAPFPFA